MKLAVFTDLDDTFFGTTAAAHQASQSIISLLRRRHIPLFAVTGRSFDMIPDPSPFAGLACEVGTRLYLKQSNKHYAISRAYDRYVQKESDFHHTTIHLLCEKLLHKIHKQFPKINLQFQPLQQKYKISFTFTSATKQGVQLQKIFQNHFKKMGYPKIQVVLSLDKILPNQQLIYDLDILAAGKETAVAYLATKYNYQPIVAGDGGNDIHLLLHNPWPAIIVGGYKPELGQALQRYRKTSPTKTIYLESNRRRRGPVSLLHGLRTMLP